MSYSDTKSLESDTVTMFEKLRDGLLGTRDGGTDNRNVLLKLLPTATNRTPSLAEPLATIDIQM